MPDLLKCSIQNDCSKAFNCHRLCSHDTQRALWQCCPSDAAHFHAVFHSCMQEKQRSFQGGSSPSRCPRAHFQNRTKSTFSYHGTFHCLHSVRQSAFFFKQLFTLPWKETTYKKDWLLGVSGFKVPRRENPMGSGSPWPCGWGTHDGLPLGKVADDPSGPHPQVQQGMQ